MLELVFARIPTDKEEGCEQTLDQQLERFSPLGAPAEDYNGCNPAQVVRRPKVDADYSSTQELDIDQARALLAAAERDGLCSHALVSLLD